MQLLTLTVIYLLLVPCDRIRKFLLPLIAVAIAIFVNGIRLAILAIVATPGAKQAFDYWHEGDGSLIFSMIAVAAFGAICYAWTPSATVKPAKSTAKPAKSTAKLAKSTAKLAKSTAKPPESVAPRELKS
jgi:exosortase/archaeosortase family protein